MHHYALASFIFVFGAAAWGQDAVYLTNGNEINGTIVQQNDQQIILQMQYGSVTLDRSQISKIVDQPEPPLTAVQRGTAEATTRFPRWSTVIADIASQPWGTNFRQVPATVMAVGGLPYVPYLSFNCGNGYIVNVYGNLDNPIAFEFGLSGQLATDDSAKQQIVAFAAKILAANNTDSTLLLALNLAKDSVSHNGLKMDVVPPTDPNSYGSWWLTVSFPAHIASATIQLNQLSTIAVPVTAVAVPGNMAAWNATEMQQAQTIAAQNAALQAAAAQTAAAQNAAAQAAAQAAAAAAQSTNNGYAVYNTGYVYPRAYTSVDGVYAHPAAVYDHPAGVYDHPAAAAAYHPAYRR